MDCCTHACNQGRACLLHTAEGGETVENGSPIPTPGDAIDWTAIALTAGIFVCLAFMGWLAYRFS